MTMKMKLRTVIVLWCLGAALPLQAQALRPISGVVVTSKDEAVYGVTVIASSNIGEQRTVTDNDGRFQLDVPSQEVTLRFEGQNIRPQERTIGLNEATVLRVEIEFLIPPIHQSMVIVASALEPSVETHSDEVYKKTLFSRDDQLIETLNAGINAGQHEGGGKSLEIRRFGFNLDHGGVNGGLKVLVDDIQQNQGTQGHGQSYLGALKTLTPELIQDVSILNGPFSAEYGDFSGLGVVYSSVRYRHIGNYRLDGKDATIRAAGLDVIDLAVTRSIRGWIDFNVAVDNLTNKHYYETQNFFESRVSPTAEAMERIHGTAGYPIGVTAGLTFHLAGK